MKRKAIRQLATTLKEQQRFPLYSRELTGWPNWQRLTREKSVKMLLNWQKYAPETDQLEAKDRETSVTGDKTGIGSIKKAAAGRKIELQREASNRNASALWFSHVWLWEFGQQERPSLTSLFHAYIILLLHQRAESHRPRVTAPLSCIRLKSANRAGNIEREQTAQPGLNYTTFIDHRVHQTCCKILKIRQLRRLLWSTKLQSFHSKSQEERFVSLRWLSISSFLITNTASLMGKAVKQTPPCEKIRKKWGFLRASKHWFKEPLTNGCDRTCFILGFGLRLMDIYSTQVRDSCTPLLRCRSTSTTISRVSPLLIKFL